MRGEAALVGREEKGEPANDPAKAKRHAALHDPKLVAKVRSDRHLREGDCLRMIHSIAYTASIRIADHPCSAVYRYKRDSCFSPTKYFGKLQR